jgi:AhpD family alkylhydroperoxidase
MVAVTTTSYEITPRLSARRLAPDAYQAMVAFDNSVEFDPRLRELVKIRASQLNGCAFCLDMHTKDARDAHEDERRLATLAGWHESPFFTPRERAALALTDAVTRLGDHGVSDAVWAEATEHFEEAELAQLLWAIVAINAWNRIGVTTRLVPRS